MTEDATPGASYAAAGVDIEAGDRAVELFAPHAKRATRPEVMGGLGGFAGLFALKGGYKEPLLAASTDGVGTKLAVAQALDKHDTVGLDLVAMVVDDLVVCGASRCSCRTTSPSVASCPSGSRRSSQASPKAASRPVARCSVARPPSIRASWPPTTTTCPRPAWVSSRPRSCSDPTRAPRRRRHRDGRFRSALERLLARPQGAARHRQDEPDGARRRVRSHPR